MPDLGFRAFDADHHYYEHEEAFQRPGYGRCDHSEFTSSGRRGA